MPEPLYKPLARGGRPAFGGRGCYCLPAGGVPGPWLPDLGWVVPRERGYHLCTRETLWDWLHEEIYAAEGRGARVAGAGVQVYASVRLLRRLRWGRDDALQLFDEQLADLEERCAREAVPVPRPYRHIGTEWRHLRDHIAASQRWYRAFTAATERVVVAMSARSCQHEHLGAGPCAHHRESAERHVRAAFWAHLLEAPPTAVSRRRSA